MVRVLSTPQAYLLRMVELMNGSARIIPHPSVGYSHVNNVENGLLHPQCLYGID
jgi:hypothetical protein